MKSILFNIVIGSTWTSSRNGRVGSGKLEAVGHPMHRNHSGALNNSRK